MQAKVLDRNPTTLYHSDAGNTNAENAMTTKPPEGSPGETPEEDAGKVPEEGKPKGRNPSKDVELKSVRWFLVVACIVYALSGFAGLVLFALSKAASEDVLAVWGVGFLIIGACVALGSLVGFIFGIPRTLQRPDRTNTSPEADKANTPQYGANTNLEEISDWLTKILVGVGLTQLGDLPEALEGIVAYLADRIGVEKCELFILGLLLWSVIGGFFLGYLFARTILPKAFVQAAPDAEPIERTPDKENPPSKSEPNNEEKDRQ